MEDKEIQEAEEIADDESEEEIVPKNKPGDKGFLTLFIIMIPSLIIAMSSAIPNQLVRIPIQVVVLLSQFIVVKSFIDDYQKLRE